jgi:uncharacterized membrane protein YhaH (DUF805 family)
MNESGLENEYPGIGRLHYFLAHIGMIAAVVFVVTVFGPESRVVSITGLVLMVARFVLDSMRLKNIGVSQWFAFLRYVPFGKTLLGFGLLCAQTGWIESRRLDSAGKSILIAELVLLALILFILFRTGITVFGIPDSGFQIF